MACPARHGPQAAQSTSSLPRSPLLLQAPLGEMGFKLSPQRGRSYSFHGPTYISLFPGYLNSFEVHMRTIKVGDLSRTLWL